MADRNINEAIRKPRRTKGTPFFSQRNYYTIGLLGLGVVCAYIYNLWPESGKLRKSIKEGKFKDPPAVTDHILQRRLALEPHYKALLDGLKARQDAREDAQYRDDSQPESWWVKLTKMPET